MIAGNHRVIIHGALFCVLFLSQSAYARQPADTDWTIKFLHSIGNENQSQTDTIKNVLLRNQGRQILTCGMDGTVCLWDSETHLITRRFFDPDNSVVWCIDMTSDEKLLVAGGKGKHVNVWDIETGELVSAHESPPNVYSVAWLNDNLSFLGADDRGFVSRWKTGEKKPVNEWRICTGDVTALAVSNGNTYFVTGNNDGEVQLWDTDPSGEQDEIPEPKCIRSFVGLTTWICCVKLSDDGLQLVASDYSGNVALWDFQTGKLKWLAEKVAGDIGWVEFENDEWIVAVDADDKLHRLNRKTGKHAFKNIKLPAIAGFALSEDRQTIWCGGNSVPCAWSIETGARHFPPDEIMQWVDKTSSVAVRGDKLFVSSGEPPVLVWDLINNSLAFQINVTDSGDWSKMSMLATRAGLVLANESQAVLFDYDSGEQLNSKKIAANSFMVSPDGDKTLYLDNESQTAYLELDFDKSTSISTEFSDEYYVQAMRLLDSTRFLVLNQDDHIQIRSLEDNSIISQAAASNYSDVLDATSMAIAFSQPGGFPAVHFARNASSSEIDEATFRQLVDDLESDEFLVRENATTLLAGGGPEIERQVSLITKGSIEQAARIQRIQKMIGDGQLPDLENPLTFVDPSDHTIEAVCFDRTSRYMLASARAGWKSDLHIYELRNDGLYLVAKQSLRSRATLIRRSLKNDSVFVIGYGGGAVDVIEIGKAP